MVEIKDIYGEVIYTNKSAKSIKEALCEAVKHVTNLRGADLCGADLRGADLLGADLWGANLRGANLRGADLRDANLWSADLRGTDLRGADLWGANMYIPLACPSHGEFVGWKKVNNCIVKLLIPEYANRLSATTNKCRCDKAKVLEITDINSGEQKEFIINKNYVVTKYEVGKVVEPDSFDDNRWNECSHGIHFFINKEEALSY